jgi:4-hydroxy-tetrahydrodipicolinate reductase
MLKVAIIGSRGRMGKMLINCAAERPELVVAATADLGDDLAQAVGSADVVIDFSFHETTLPVAQLCSSQGKPLVIGTTGHTPEEKKAIGKTVENIPVVWASNYSTGVNTLFWLARKATELLGPSFDIEVVEMHHRHKKDAPSGTADTLGRILAEARKKQYEEVVRHGREGLVGERTAEEIGMHSLRGGDVVGDHTVIFAADGERVELTHKASSRDTFARGALRAALWCAGKKPGIYTMQDVLNLT